MLSLFPLLETTVSLATQAPSLSCPHPGALSWPPLNQTTRSVVPHGLPITLAISVTSFDRDLWINLKKMTLISPYNTLFLAFAAMDVLGFCAVTEII